MFNLIKDAARAIVEAKRVCAFTGAGISVESGIPPFRGKNGLWNKINPDFIEISTFLGNPGYSWPLIKEIFYDSFGRARPNPAHDILAQWEQKGHLHCIITQNIDNLHQRAGSQNVLEFHGTSERMICLDCQNSFAAHEINLRSLPPECPECIVGRIKPDFIFFGEGIPEPARTLSFNETDKSDLFIVIGTTGEVMPASMLPQLAKQNGALIVEINPANSAYTRTVSDIFLQGPASEILTTLNQEICNFIKPDVQT